MRIAIAGLALESVSFLPVEAGVDVFEANAVRGAALIPALDGSATVGGGFVDILGQAGADIIPLVYTDCSAAGPASDAAFDHYRAEITDGLKAEAGRLDGVLLYLHGAMTTPTRTDPERDILNAVREVIGDSLPLVVAFDLHANLSTECAALCTALFGFHYSPHTDMDETGRRAARCLVGTIRGEIKPVVIFQKAPVVLPSIFTATGLPPLSEIVAAGLNWERTEDAILDVSIFCGFAYADVPEIGFSVAVITDGAAEVGARACQDLVKQIDRERHALMQADTVYNLADGVSRALDKATASDRPVVILEHADRMNDSTWVLRELVSRKATRVAVPYLWDPQSAKRACDAGTGAFVRLDVGGRSSDRAGGPVTLSGTVLFAGEKTYTGTGPMRRGRRVSLGLTAVIDADGIMVWITSLPTSAIDEDCFDQFGFKSRDFDLIVLRSKTHFRAVYEDLAAEILIIDTPDWGPADLTTLPYRNARPGVYPITCG